MSAPTNSTRNFIPMQQKYDRVVLLVDMDCFYCQVEEKLNPELRGKPVAVVQYNAWRGGGIIAVNYAARAQGVTRHMRGDEAKEQCPDIQLVKVPNVREKADLSKYREAGKEVANVLQKFTNLLERASVDEAYLDITEAVNKRLNEMNAGTFTLQPQELIDTFAVGYERFGDYLKAITTHFADPYCDDELLNRQYDPNDIPAVRQSDVRLLLGASIASEIRAAVKAQTTYECSAGIAHNKIIAKLACGMNKPNKQTIMPLNRIEGLFETLPLGKIKGLGGKYGEEVCERLKIKTLGQMLKYTEAELQNKFDEKNGTWLFYISRGIDLEAVTPRFYSKSIGCCKKFPGRNNITGLNTLKHWLNELATEIAERLEKDIIENNRKAKQMTVSYIQELDGEEVSSSRSVPLLGYEQESLALRSLEVLKANTKQFFQPGSDAVLHNPIKFLGISVGKFESIASGQSKLQEMFANQALRKRKSEPKQPKTEEEEGVVVENPPTAAVGKTCAKPTEAQKKGSMAHFLQSQAKAKPTAESVNEVKRQATPKNEEVNKKSPVKSFFMKALKKSSTATNSNNNSMSSSSNNSSLDDALKNDNSNDSKFNSNASNDSYGSPARKRLKMPATETANTTLTTNVEPSASSSNYKSQYAEYALPDLSLDLLEFQKCELCGAKIPLEENAIQTHRDHHFAHELSQQLRAEFRSQNNNKTTTTTTKPSSSNTTKSSNNSKKSSSSSASATLPAITRYLKPRTSMSLSSSFDEEQQQQPTTSADAVAANQSIECEQCKQLVRQSDFSEHLDYHVAKQLQLEMNKQAMHTVVITKKQTSTSAATTKQQQPKKPSKRATKPILKFFQQTQN